MKGRVVGINPSKGYIAVDTSTGITVMELLGGYDVDPDDIISGDLEALGSEVVLNETQAEKMDVFIQGVHCTVTNARALME